LGFANIAQKPFITRFQLDTLCRRKKLSTGYLFDIQRIDKMQYAVFNWLVRILEVPNFQPFTRDWKTGSKK